MSAPNNEPDHFIELPFHEVMLPVDQAYIDWRRETIPKLDRYAEKFPHGNMEQTFMQLLYQMYKNSPFFESHLRDFMEPETQPWRALVGIYDPPIRKPKAKPKRR